MKYIHYLLNKQPLASALVIPVLAFITTALIFALFVSVHVSPQVVEHYAKMLTGLLLILALYGTGTVIEPRTCGKYWLLASLLMALSVPLNLLVNHVDIAALVFTKKNTWAWLMRSLASGVWEESMFRGACFTLLFRAWGSTRSALLNAAITHALLFGSIHLINLFNINNAALENVLFQIPRAALAGFGFAGLYVYSRSLWPPIVLHAGINAAGSFDNFFAGPNYIFVETTTYYRVMELSVILLFVALPGLWCLMKTPMDGSLQGCLNKNQPE
jgi:membrane protease YdiL (CAAX protease family)